MPKDCVSLIIIHQTPSTASDPWSSETSGVYLTLQLGPDQSSLDWGESLEPGPDSEEFLRPPATPIPAEKKVDLVLSCYFEGGTCGINNSVNFQSFYSLFRWSQRLSIPSGSLGATWSGRVTRKEPKHQVNRRRWRRWPRKQPKLMKDQIPAVKQCQVIVMIVMGNKLCPINWDLCWCVKGIKQGAKITDQQVKGKWGV